MDELPEVDGGWEVLDVDVGAADPVRLWAPREPDRLLDDEQVVERSQFNDSMPYWAWLWDSGPTMARLLARESIGGQAAVLELGAGLGLAGIAAAVLGGPGVDLVLTDHDPLSLAALPVNARRNGIEARVWDLDWRHLGEAPEGRFDLILGCDVAYEAKLQEPLLDVVDRYLAPGGVALFADPGRTRLLGFVRRATARGYRVELEDAEGSPAELEAAAFRLVRLRRESAAGAG
ncbi:MAG: 50S ribosomal protein L11 methyltransferase [Planctomycetota bacterium]